MPAPFLARLPKTFLQASRDLLGFASGQTHQYADITTTAIAIFLATRVLTDVGRTGQRRAGALAAIQPLDLTVEKPIAFFDELELGLPLGGKVLDRAINDDFVAGVRRYQHELTEAIRAGVATVSGREQWRRVDKPRECPHAHG